MSNGQDDVTVTLIDGEGKRVFPLTIKLRYPIDWGGDRIDQITMRRGRLADIKGCKISQELSMEQVMTVAARLSGLPAAALERLDQEDAGEVIDVALDFYRACLTAGSKRSE